MKKLLLATSALVASAGIASADMELTGSANMGVKYQEDRAAGLDEGFLHYEIDFNVVGSGTTDGGLTFGASIDLDASIDPVTGDQDGLNEDFDPEVFVSGNFGTLTMGNLDPASDALGIDDLGFDGIGIDDVAETEKVVGSANVGYEYAFGDFAAAVTAHSVNDDYGVSLSYAPEMYSVAIAYDHEDATDDESWTITGGSTFGAFGVQATYTDYDTVATGNGNSYGLLGSYQTGALTVSAEVADSDATADTSYGIGASYDLGGGASLDGAVGSIDSATRADFGVNFSF